MTSTYDSLWGLYDVAQKNPDLKPLIESIFDYAIVEVNKVNPKILNWDSWISKPINKVYGTGLQAKAEFLSDAHSILDHNPQYHFKTMNHRLEFIISRIDDCFVRYSDREYIDRFMGLGDFDKETRDRYPKVFKELKALIENGLIQIPEWDSRTKKKVAKWE